MGNLDLATITVIIGFAAAIMTIAMGGAIVVTIDDDVCPFFHDPSFLASPGAPALYVLSLCVLFLSAFLLFTFQLLALLTLPLSLHSFSFLSHSFSFLSHSSFFLRSTRSSMACFLCLLPSLSSLEISGGGNLNEKNVGTIINIRTL